MTLPIHTGRDRLSLALAMLSELRGLRDRQGEPLPIRSIAQAEAEWKAKVCRAVY